MPDIHCFAATADSSRSVVIDLTRIEPDGFRAVPAPTLARPTDEILYELHVRDYSIRDSSCPPAQRGTYLGLIHEHQRDSTGASSGLSHLVDLGITAVHLLPVHDFTAKPDEYNWGYWTTLFNVPESNYATDRADPTSAIRDLRTAITGLHRAGIRVILDVVYNHTSSAGPDSPFDATVPSYFFRTTRDGRLVNDTDTINNFLGQGLIQMLGGIFALIATFIATKTPFGRQVYAVGGNERAAELSGVRTTWIKVIVYMISGFCAAVVGLIITSQLVAAHPATGTSYELNAIAVVVLGDGAFEVTLRLIGESAVVVRVRVLGIDLDGLGVVGDGHTEVAVLSVGITPAAVGICMIRIEFDSLTIVCDSLVEITLLAVGIAPIVVATFIA